MVEIPSFLKDFNPFEPERTKTESGTLSVSTETVTCKGTCSGRDSQWDRTGWTREGVG